MRCPSCNNEMSIDPVDATKVICYSCRKRYPADKVNQYWDEKARIDANRTAVGEEAYSQKEAAAVYGGAPAAQSQYGVPYQPAIPQSTPYTQPQPAPQPVVQPAYPAQSQPYAAQPVAQPVPVQPQPAVQPQSAYSVPASQSANPYASPQPAQPAPAPMPYGTAPSPYGYPAPVDAISKQIMGFAIASLCTGIAGILILPLVFGACALVFGILSLTKASKNMRKKKGMAIAGVVLGSIALFIWLLGFIGLFLPSSFWINFY